MSILINPYRLVVVVPPFSPLSLSPTAWYDPSDLTTLWQDSARTVPVVADGDVVGCIDDKSGNGNHLPQATTANKPAYRTAGGLHWLTGDGVNDRLQVAFTLVQPFERVSAIAQITWTASRRIYASMTSNSALLYQSGVSPNLQLYSGTALDLTNEPAIGTNFVVTERFNGVSTRAAVNNSAYVTGNVGIQNPAGFTLFSETNGSTPANAACYGVFIRAGATLTDAEITSLRTWYAAKAGITI